MKFAKTLLALAVVGATFAAHAESNINTTGTAGASATAKLDFRVTIPKIIFLQVGTGTNLAANTTVDRVDFNVAAASLGNGTAVSGVSTGGTVNASVVGNGGNVTFSATGTAGGLTNGLQTIAWSQITPTATGALVHPAISGASSTLTATSGVVNQQATYTFSYSNSAPVAAGQYNGTVTYTAANP